MPATPLSKRVLYVLCTHTEEERESAFTLLFFVLAKLPREGSFFFGEAGEKKKDKVTSRARYSRGL